jgi:hypothetical protein
VENMEELCYAEVEVRSRSVRRAPSRNVVAGKLDLALSE